jgi:hypothetical protein
MSEAFPGPDRLPDVYLEIDEGIEPGARGTGIESSLTGQLAGMAERVINWHNRTYKKASDRDWDPYFNSQICREWENLVHRADEAMCQVELRLQASPAHKVYAQLLRWEKYRGNYALYGEVELLESTTLNIAYAGRHMIHGSRSDRLFRDSDPEQIYIGDPNAGWKVEDIISGLAISMSQLAHNLQRGAELNIIPACQ